MNKIKEAVPKPVVASFIWIDTGGLKTVLGISLKEGRTFAPASSLHHYPNGINDTPRVTG